MNDPKLNAALHPLEVHADGEAVGNDRSAWPYVVEADEREALTRVLFDAEPEIDTYLGGREAAWHHDGIRAYYEAQADAILAAGFRRSQPAPRTVSAAEVTAAYTMTNDLRGSYLCRPWVNDFLAALGIAVDADR